MTDPAHDPKTGKSESARTDASRPATGETDAAGRKGPARAAATVGPEQPAGSQPGATGPSVSSGAGVETEQPGIDTRAAEHPYSDQPRGDLPYSDEGYGAQRYGEERYGEERRYAGEDYEALRYADERYDQRHFDERRIGERRARVADLGSVPRLLRRLLDDTATLVRKELALATSEVSKSVEDVKTGAVSMATGGAVLYLGIMFLLAAATLALALFMPGWAAALIVGGVVTLVGVVMLVGGKQKMEPSMKRTARSLRKDQDMIERQTR